MGSLERFEPSTALVLCGGRGERMGAEYRDMQKTAMDLGGVALLEVVVRGVVGGENSPNTRGAALLVDHASDDVRREVDQWPEWLADRVVAVRDYHIGEHSLTDIVSDLPSPRTMVSGNVILDYPSVLNQVDGMLEDEPDSPVVVGSTLLRTSTHYAVDVMDARVTALTRRASTPADREVVDVFGLTDESIELSDRDRIPFPTALANHALNLTVRYVEYEGPWAHFETPEDFERYKAGEYGRFDFD